MSQLFVMQGFGLRRAVSLGGIRSSQLGPEHCARQSETEDFHDVTSWADVPNWIPAGRRGSRHDGIVLQHLAFVKALAVRIYRNLPVVVDLNDLFQAGVLGLLDAVATYDTSKNGSFHSYAKQRVKDTIFDSLRQLDWAPRCVRQNQERLDPIATKGPMDVSINRRTCVQMRNSMSAAACFPRRCQEGDASGLVASPETQPDQIWERNERHQTLTRAVECLPKRYRKVLVLYYNDEMTIKQISGVLGVSESRISQIHRKALQKMSTELQSEGFALRRYFTMGPAPLYTRDSAGPPKEGRDNTAYRTAKHLPDLKRGANST